MNKADKVTIVLFENPKLKSSFHLPLNREHIEKSFKVAESQLMRNDQPVDWKDLVAGDTYMLHGIRTYRPDAKRKSLEVPPPLSRKPPPTPSDIQKLVEVAPNNAKRPTGGPYLSTEKLTEIIQHYGDPGTILVGYVLTTHGQVEDIFKSSDYQYDQKFEVFYIVLKGSFQLRAGSITLPFLQLEVNATDGRVLTRGSDSNAFKYYEDRSQLLTLTLSENTIVCIPKQTENPINETKTPDETKMPDEIKKPEESPLKKQERLKSEQRECECNTL